MYSDCPVVCFPCYMSEWRSALSLQIPLTFCALFFCVLLKLEEISPRFRYFLEYMVRFYIFVKLEEISPRVSLMANRDLDYDS